MKISKELIEKYHGGQCTPAEVVLVENWLLDDVEDETFEFPENIDKGKIASEMWNNIVDILPSNAQKSRSSIFFIFQSYKYLSIAAAIAFIILSASFYLFYQKSDETLITAINKAGTTNKEIFVKDYTISLGPESNANIDVNNDLIHFCGSMLISPKKDIAITVKGLCANSADQNNKIHFKKGENYIILDNPNTQNSQVIIMDEKMLMGLPPVMKRQLMDQFNI